MFHAVFVMFWYSLILVPASLFPNRDTFCFYLTIVIVFHQFIWGFLIMPWTKKYRMVCLLTTLTQLLRGQKVSDPKNYDHSFTQEAFKKVGINIPHRATTLITLSVLVIATVRYFF
jgi:hypothetical protein